MPIKNKQNRVIIFALDFFFFFDTSEPGAKCNFLLSKNLSK